MLKWLKIDIISIIKDSDVALFFFEELQQILFVNLLKVGVWDFVTLAHLIPFKIYHYSEG